MVREFKRAGATGVIFYDKWHDGLVPHKTKLTSYMTERDLLGDTLKALRKHGMKAVVYYSLGYDANPDPKFRDWACRDSDGKPMGRCFPGDWMSFHSPYRDYVTDQLVEILGRYGPLDGLWLDILEQPSPLSRDPYTESAFRKMFGKPVVEASDGEVEEFLIQTYRSFLRHIREKFQSGDHTADLRRPGIGCDGNFHRLTDPLEAVLSGFDEPIPKWVGSEQQKSWKCVKRIVGLLNLERISPVVA